MFVVTTKGRYATRAMLELASWKGDSHARLSDIAAAQKISLKYLSRIMTALVSAGLVRSRRGKNGGFDLGKPPSKIRLYDILRAVEGPVEPAPCTGRRVACGKFDRCVTRDVWIGLKNGLISMLEGISLEDLVRRHHGMPDIANRSGFSLVRPLDTRRGKS